LPQPRKAAGDRDAMMLLVAHGPGLRASELTDLRWDQVDFSTANLHVRRAKKGSSPSYPILGDEYALTFFETNPVGLGFCSKEGPAVLSVTLRLVTCRFPQGILTVFVQPLDFNIVEPFVANLKRAKG
jgi:hypothetical protein